jgi:hypothetical protein
MSCPFCLPPAGAAKLFIFLPFFQPHARRDCIPHCSLMQQLPHNFFSASCKSCPPFYVFIFYFFIHLFFQPHTRGDSISLRSLMQELPNQYFSLMQ